MQLSAIEEKDENKSIGALQNIIKKDQIIKAKPQPSSEEVKGFAFPSQIKQSGQIEEIKQNDNPELRKSVKKFFDQINRADSYKDKKIEKKKQEYKYEKDRCSSSKEIIEKFKKERKPGQEH